MNKINFAVIKLTSKGVKYSEREYKIEENEKGDKLIKRVDCWNGTHDLPFYGTPINLAWANEFPLGTIESKMWCDDEGLKMAKKVLKKTLDEFLVDWIENSLIETKDKKNKMMDKWINNKYNIK